MLSRCVYAVTSRKCRLLALERRGLVALAGLAAVALLVVAAVLLWRPSIGAVAPARASGAPLGGLAAAATRAEVLARAAEAAAVAAEEGGDEQAVREAEAEAAAAAGAAALAEEAANAAASGLTTTSVRRPSPAPHPAIPDLVKRYAFQPVRTQRGQLVNVVLVRAPFRSRDDFELYNKYKEEILFLGICSFEDFPLPPENPFSEKFPADTYVGLFPGWLHMFREPENIFPSDVKLLLMSQSDFSLPSRSWLARAKQYDFVYSGSDQDVHNDCVGWSSFAKNWTFVKQALEVMCGEYGMTGVLVATKDKAGRKACSIPDVCAGKVVQTSFLDQGDFFNYVRQSRWLFLPQVHDASPRVTTQALALGVPMLMNWHLLGGWKYLVEGKTGEFFHDMSDFRDALDRIRRGSADSQYAPREFVTQAYGDKIQGRRLMEWVEQNFADRVQLPSGTRLLTPSGA